MKENVFLDILLDFITLFSNFFVVIVTQTYFCLLNKKGFLNENRNVGFLHLM